MASNLNTLQKFLNALDHESLSREEFLSAFKSVVEFVKRIEVQNLKDIQSLKDTIAIVKDKLEKDNSTKLSDINGQLQGSFNKLFEEHSNTMNFLKDKMNNFEAKRTQKDTELIENAVEKALSLVPEVEFPETDPAVKDALEVLQGEIKSLRTDLKDLQESKKLGGGGGTSAMGVRFALGKGIVKETPTGDINGSNKAYTLSRQPTAILSLAINGQVINDDEYTLAGNTITMTSAIPADLSGTSFRITYL